ncbi:MAG: hypothetical protein RMJ31_03615 [Nitrososphaerota archaeon]|nr:hypothetical protein [Nitrososphaerales archaeon]MCX8191345.1 hypothetical protein [Nitrososphaerales archaeon]MDW8044844.1 hypothetical protein [Nitrososphaerota archaeon]
MSRELDPSIKKLYKIFAIIALVVLCGTSIYGIVATIIQGVDVVGETLVTIEFPYITVFPLFYAKPVTWMVASLIVLTFTMLELNKQRIAKVRKPVRDFLRFFLFFVGSMALYEVMFNFTLWSGLISAAEIRGELNPDLIKNPFPNPKTPWNIVFATKFFTVITILSFYGFYFLQRLESEEVKSGV